MCETEKQKDVRRCRTLGYDKSNCVWILDPFVRLTDLYSNTKLCQQYNVKPPPLRVVLYQCRGCPNQVFRSSDLFVDHCRKVHSYKCELCCSIADNQTSLDHHLESRHFNKAGMCRKCDIVIREQSEFRRHLLRHGIIGNPDKKPRRMDEMPIIEYMGSLEAPELIVISDTEDEMEISTKNDKEMGTKTIKSSELKSVWNDLRVKSSCRCRTCQTFFPSIFEAYRHLKDQHSTHLRKDDTILGQVKMKVKIIKVSRTEEEKTMIPEAEKPKPKAISTPLIRVRTNLFAETPSEKSPSPKLPTQKPPPGKIIKASEVLQLHPTGSSTMDTTKDFITRPIKHEHPPPLLTIPEPPEHFNTMAIQKHSPPLHHLSPPELQPFPSPYTELLPPPQRSNLKIINVASAGPSTTVPKHPEVISVDDEDDIGSRRGQHMRLPLLPKTTPPVRRLKLNRVTNGVKKLKLTNESMYPVFDM